MKNPCQKHQAEVLAVASGPSARRRAGGMKVEEEEGLYAAMTASVAEGWSLLLRLLHMRQEVLMMASEFHSRASEVPPANVPFLTSDPQQPAQLCGGGA